MKTSSEKNTYLADIQEEDDTATPALDTFQRTDIWSRKQFLGKCSLIVFCCSQAGALLSSIRSNLLWYWEINPIRWIHPLCTVLLRWALNLPGRVDTNSAFLHVLQTVQYYLFQ